MPKAKAASLALSEYLAARGTPQEQTAAWSCAWHNRGLIHKAMYQFKHHTGHTNCTDEDLVQEALIAMTKGLATFDPSKGAFSTHIYNWIRGAVLSTIDRGTAAISYPKGLANMERDLAKGRDVPMTEATAVAIKTRWRPAFNLDTVRMVASPGLPVDDVLGMAQEHAQIRAAVAQLGGKDRAVVVGRFIEGKTLQEVGDSLNMSREGARLIERRALARLRALLSPSDAHAHDRVNLRR
jgi:RNA polymerase sigma factor (sigma-70 family)